MANSPTSSFAPYYCLVIQCLIIFSLERCIALGLRTHNLPRSHTIQLSSLLSTKPTCHSFSKGLNEGAYLKVVNRHGPCHQQRQSRPNAPTLDQILLNDKYRVAFIHSDHFNDHMDSYNNHDLNNLIESAIPVQYSSNIGITDYVVNVQLGTPKQDVSFMLDTASSFTWLLCGSDEDNSNFFTQSTSTTIANISCPSPLCSQLNSTTGIVTTCHESTCIYAIQFRDKSYTEGIGNEDRLTLTSSQVVDNFPFGCSVFYSGLKLGASGVLGLGRGNVSLLDQTKKKYKQVFSYCLPSTPYHRGYLTFGNVNSDSIKYVPLKETSHSSTYSLVITGISVAGRKLQIPKTVFSKSNAIIDTGVVLTRLPPTAYDALQVEFEKWMEHYPKTEGLHLLDTCYNLTGYDSFEIPKVSFHFGNEVEVKIHQMGTIYIENISKICLAFVRNEHESEMTLFGNTQQRTLQVVHDVGRGRIGFGPKHCG